MALPFVAVEANLDGLANRILLEYARELFRPWYAFPSDPDMHVRCTSRVCHTGCQPPCQELLICCSPGDACNDAQVGSGESPKTSRSGMAPQKRNWCGQTSRLLGK